MRKWPLLLGVALLIAGGGIWFWLLGSLPKEHVPRVHLSDVRGSVEVRSSGSSQWSAAHEDQDVHAGDAVRTGGGASASIRFDGKAETRLQESTEIHIEQAERTNGTPFVVLLQLVTGRAWNRVLRLLDLDESFRVRTNSIIASVRGTAFDLDASATGTALLVSDAAVEVTHTGVPFIVAEGSVVTFDAKGTVLGTLPLNEATRQSQWFGQNISADESFVRSTVEGLSAQLGGSRVRRPGSFTDTVALYSERAHLAVSGAAAPERFARYVARRLFAVQRLIQDGNSGVASQALASIESDVAARITGPDGAQYRKQLKLAVGDVLFFMHDVTAVSPLYRMKQRLEDLNVTLASDDVVSTAYAHLLAIEARLDEADGFLNTAAMNDAKNALDAAHQGLQNVERDIDQESSTVPEERVRVLRGKLDILKAREAALRTRLGVTLTPPAATTSTSATSTVPVVSSTSTAETVVTEITLRALPNPAKVGDAVRLSVMATLEDGTTTDVTAKTLFGLSGNLGELNGPTFTASKVGSVTIQARYGQGDDAVTASLVLQIQDAPVTVKSLEIRAQGSTSPSLRTRVPLIIVALYSNGTSKDVTPLVQISTSNPSIASMIGNVLMTGEVPGFVTVTASYTEQGVMAKGAIDFQVTQ